MGSGHVNPVKPEPMTEEEGIESIVICFIDRIQAPDALGQLNYKHWKKGGCWSVEPFGCNLDRGSAKRLLQHLKVPLLAGLQRIQCSPNTLEYKLRSYIVVYLVHHVMQCLFASGDETVELQFEGLGETFLKDAKLPDYSTVAIQAFVNQYLVHFDGDAEVTVNVDEKTFLSITLADKIIEVLKRIDVAEFVFQVCTTYQEKERQIEIVREARASVAMLDLSLVRRPREYEENTGNAGEEKKDKDDEDDEDGFFFSVDPDELDNRY